jgi:hypothetical protein
MRVYKLMPRDQISNEGWASYYPIYYNDAYKSVIIFPTVIKDPLLELKDVPKSVIKNISYSPIYF